MLLAKKGFHRKVISERVGISVGSVEQQISTSPDLVKWRKHCRHNSKKRRYKVNIIRYQEYNPSSTRQQIKAACYAAFYWLYKHEPMWLESHLPKAILPKTQPRVDWNNRDLLIADNISKIICANSYKLSRTQLDKQLGNHGWLLKFKNKLPLTMQEYERLTSHPSDLSNT